LRALLAEFGVEELERLRYPDIEKWEKLGSDSNL
jgi:hypothetical protein